MFNGITFAGISTVSVECVEILLLSFLRWAHVNIIPYVIACVRALSVVIAHKRQLV